MASPSRQRISELRINAILVLFAGWIGANAISGWAWFLRTAPDPGLTNGEMALGWQGIAGIAGFAVWAMALGLPKGHGIRRTAPAALGVTLAVAGLAWAGLF